MEEKVAKSVFVKDLDVTPSQLLTELIIKNYCHWKKIELPNSPFWKKEYAINETLKFLSEKYKVEISYIKNLIKVFDISVLTKYFTESKPIGFRYAKKEQQALMIYELYQLQLKYLESIPTPEKIITENYNGRTATFKASPNKTAKLI